MNLFLKNFISDRDSPQSRAIFSQYFISRATSDTIPFAVFASSIYSSEESIRMSRSDSLVSLLMRIAWCLSNDGLRSYAGESVHHFSVKRKEWLRKWSSQLPMHMLKATRRYSSSRFFSGSAQLPTINSTISQ